MKDKLNITIRLADLDPMAMSVKLQEEEIVRSAEYNVNLVWSKWMEAYKKNKTSKEVLAMVAYQFAKMYLEQRRKSQATQEVLTQFEDELDQMLLKVE